MRTWHACTYAFVIGILLGLWAGDADMRSDAVAGLVSATLAFTFYMVFATVTDKEPPNPHERNHP